MPIDLWPAPQFDDPERGVRLQTVLPVVDSMFAEHVTRHHIPGAAYGVVLDGGLIHTAAVGVREVSTGAPVTPNTIFRIASMTKSFTAMAIVKLRDEGRLSLDDPVERFVPEVATWISVTGDAPRLTVRHLLTMAGGLPQDDPWADRQLALAEDALSTLFTSGASFANPPGITFEYSNLGYMLLGRIVSNVAGVPVASYVAQQILGPLGMQATVWDPGQAPANELAHGYRWQDERWLEESLLPHGGDVAAFAGLCTNVCDLARYVAYFLTAWPPRNDAEEGPLRRSSLRAMQQVERSYHPVLTQSAIDQMPALVAGGYGYGLSILSDGGRTSVGHSGGLPGFGSNMRWLPDHGLGIVALGNLTYAPMGLFAARALAHMQEAAALPPRRPQPAPALVSIRERLNRLVERWDDALADALFAGNFFLDVDRDRRRAELARLHQRHGALRPDGPLRVENALRGEWRLRGERGWCTVWISLAPTMPPRIQAMEITSVLPPSPPMLRAAADLASLTARPTKRGVRRLCTSSADRTAIYRQLQEVTLRYGSCTVVDFTAGDGDRQASFRFAGNAGNLTVHLTLAPGSDKLEQVTFLPATRG